MGARRTRRFFLGRSSWRLWMWLFAAASGCAVTGAVLIAVAASAPPSGAWPLVVFAVVNAAAAELCRRAAGEKPG